MIPPIITTIIPTISTAMTTPIPIAPKSFPTHGTPLHASRSRDSRTLTRPGLRGEGTTSRYGSRFVKSAPATSWQVGFPRPSVARSALAKGLPSRREEPVVQVFCDDRHLNEQEVSKHVAAPTGGFPRASDGGRYPRELGSIKLRRTPAWTGRVPPHSRLRRGTPHRPGGGWVPPATRLPRGSVAGSCFWGASA
jgi:hypothetical protein